MKILKQPLQRSPSVKEQKPLANSKQQFISRIRAILEADPPAPVWFSDDLISERQSFFFLTGTS